MTTVVCDLDGVLYRGDTVVPGAGEALQRLHDGGVKILFVTNNASRTRDNVGAKITRVTGYQCESEAVLTSPMAAVPMLHPEDDPVLVVGEEGITEVLKEAGFHVTRDPGEARAVMVGVAPGFNYQALTEASDAVRNGARFIATNLDPTFPIAGGFQPGAGSIVAAIATAGGREPEVAGKPYAPMRDLVRSKVNGPLWVIGDRLDSDIAMAAAEPGWTSILVLTGATGPDDDHQPADHVVADIREAASLILSAGA